MKINCEIDTMTSEAKITKDGMPIDHHTFSVSSYFMDGYEDGMSPSQYCSFSHSKSDGSITNSCYGSFKVGDKKSYAEHKSLGTTVANACAKVYQLAKAQLVLEGILSTTTKDNK